jgi:hypothetical protein
VNVNEATQSINRRVGWHSIEDVVSFPEQTIEKNQGSLMGAQRTPLFLSHQMPSSLPVAEAHDWSLGDLLLILGS